ncbi:MAG: DUF6265 family protein [Ferruginibacter sp.]
MKKLIIVLSLLACMSAVIETDNNAFEKLYALEGTWKMNSKRGAICEEWKKMDNDYLQNKGYMIKGNDTIISESVALTNTKAGIFYTSTIEDQNNKQPIAFKMTGSENNTFVFENPAHDFPKRIVYKFITADSLHAFIDDGTETGKRQNFYFKRQ